MPVIHALRGPVPSGTVIGHWTVIAEAERRWGVRHLLCRCVCGTTRPVFIGALRIGASSSCGCRIGDGTRTHGMSTRPEHMLWSAINQRCYNPNNSAYKNYGGRGIQVCERWRNSFEAFFADVGPRLSPELTLDRINNNGHYEPGNVRWTTRKVQNNNTRWTHADRVEHGRRNAMKRWHPELVTPSEPTT